AMVSGELGAGEVFVYEYGSDINRFVAVPGASFRPAGATIAGDGYGYSVAIIKRSNESGYMLAVGAPFDDRSTPGSDPENDDDNLPDSGAVYVYSNASANWDLKALLKEGAPAQDARFGTAVALANFVASPGAA